MSTPDEQPNVVRFGEAEIADIGMHTDMWLASPDGQDHMRRKLEGLPEVTIEFSGEPVPDDHDPTEGGTLN